MMGRMNANSIEMPCLCRSVDCSRLFSGSTGLFDMTTAVALEQIVFREVLGLSGFGVSM